MPQLGRLDGQVQKVLEPDAEGPPPQGMVVPIGQQDQPAAGFGHRLAESEARAIGQHVMDDHGIERAAGIAGVEIEPQPVGQPGSRGGARAGLDQGMERRLAKPRILGDQQHRNAQNVGFPALGGRIDDRRRNGEPEARALAGGAVAADRAAHQLDQPLGNGQAKAGAAESARRRLVLLGERFEEVTTLGRIETDASVVHFVAQHDVVIHRVEAFQTDLDAAALGELHCIAAEVDQHLPNPERIGPDAPRHTAVDEREERQIALFRLGLEQLGDFGDQIGRRGVDRLDRQPAGLDL